MKFRKKPVIIEAFQLTKERFESNVDWPAWLHRAWDLDNREVGSFHIDPWDHYVINTLEGAHVVSINDWIIQGVKGELYPCKPDIFEMTYEPVE